MLNLAPTSTKLISASTQLSGTPSTLLEPNIARNWAISPTLCRKIQSCPFWLKIDMHGILDVLIPNPYLDFWNLDPIIHYWANLGQKSQICPFCLKIGTHGISRMLVLILTLVFQIFNPKSIFSKFGPKKSQLSVWPENWHTEYLKDVDSYSDISFLKFET